MYTLLPSHSECCSHVDSNHCLQVGIPFFVFAGINMYAFYHMFSWAGVLPPVLFMMGGIIEGALLPATSLLVTYHILITSARHPCLQSLAVAPS